MQRLKGLTPGEAEIAGDSIEAYVKCRLKRTYSVEAERGGGQVWVAVVEFRSSAGPFGWSRQGVLLEDMKLLVEEPPTGPLTELK
jgi:hypothetical protein